MIGGRVGRYRILAPLGEGGMATVWRARDELLGHEVALKILADALANSTEARRRFRHEGDVGASLDHPGVAAVYESGESDGVTFIAMALVDGETIAERLQRSLIPVPEAQRIAIVAAAALGYAHTRGVVHRDVTSRNIMLATDGRVLVLDFGLALAQGVSRVSTSNSTVGTVAYMSPEVLLGREADPRSDLYGLGVVLYEMLTGRLPFKGDRPETLQFAALHQPIEPPSGLRPELSGALDRVVLRLLARDPQERYQNADAFVAELKTALRPGGAAGPAGVTPVGAAVVNAPARSLVADLLASGKGPLYMAIMPFDRRAVTRDAAPDAERLAAGLYDTLAASTAHLQRIHVVTDAGTRLAGEDERAFSRRIGAQLLLTGSLRAAGSHVRIAWRLLDPELGTQIAGGTLRGAATDLFDLEDQLVADVRRALGIAADGLSHEWRPSATDPAAHERYVQALHYLQRFDHEASVDGAIGILERLTAAAPDDAPLHAALGRAYLAKHGLTRQHAWEGRAASAVEHGLRVAPESPDVLVALGEMHLAASRLDDALVEFQRALAMRPQWLDAQLGIAKAHDASGRSADAEAACRDAIGMRPEDWRGYHHLGLVLFRRGEYARAVEPWRRVLQLTPDNARAASNLGSALLHMDRHGDAIAAYQHSIEIQPSAWGYTNLGTALFYERRYDEATQAFEKAVALTPSDPLMWGNLGDARRLGGAPPEESREALERAVGLMKEGLQRSPGDAHGWSRLSAWLTGLGRGREAVEAVQRAYRLAPGDASVLASAGHTHYLTGDAESALRYFETALRQGYGVEALERSPDLEPFKSDPRFQRVLQSHRASRGEREHTRIEPGR